MSSVAVLPPIVKIPAVVDDATARVIYALQARQYEVYSLTPVAREVGEPGPKFIGCGGSAGGGKSYTARTVATACCLAWPGCSGIIFRGTEREVVANHANKLLAEVPQDIGDRPLYRYNARDLMAHWETGSRLYFGFLRADNDVFTYQGNEYDFMIFDEATHYSEFQVKYLIGNRLRATVPGARPFALFPSNPGNRGHGWYKRWFIERRFHEEENEDDYAFVQMWLADNQELIQRDPGYVRALDLLPEPWRSWQRDGNWSAGAGTAFPELSYQKHVVKPFEVPSYWTLFGSFDWGFAHPWKFGLYAVNDDGRMFKVDTVTGWRQSDHQIAQRIREFIGDRPIDTIVAGHDCWADVKARGVDVPTTADLFETYHLFLERADISRVAGYKQCRARLQGTPAIVEGKAVFDEPAVLFFDTPGNRAHMASLEGMVTDPRNLEDVLKVDANEYGESGDDDYDEFRYACAYRPMAGVDRGTGTWSPWSQDALAAEHDRLYRRRTDMRAPNQATRTYEEIE